MHDLYKVSTDDIAAEMPQLFPDGFSPNTKPSDDTVKDFILSADTLVSLKMALFTGAPASATTEAATLAKRYVKLQARADTLRVVYARDPAAANAAAGPLEDRAAKLLATLDEMRSVLVIADDAAPVSQVRGAYSDRDMLVTDEMLGAGARGGSARRPF